MLHNLAIRPGVPLQELPRPDGPMPDAVPLPPPNAAGLQMREDHTDILGKSSTETYNFSFCVLQHWRWENSAIGQRFMVYLPFYLHKRQSVQETH